MSKIPDDGTMEAALYGTAHIPTKLAAEDCAKLRASLASSMAADISSMDIDAAEALLYERPDLIYSDEPLPEDAPFRETALLLRSYIRNHLAARLIDQWEEGVETRGRLIGLGEHSARACFDGTSDSTFDSAIGRFGDLGGRYRA